MGKKTRLLFLLLALTGSVASALKVSGQDSAAVEISAPVDKPGTERKLSAAQVTIPPKADTLALEKLARPEATVADANPFAAKSWYVAPPAPPPALPAKPSAPPLPFTYIGKLEEDSNHWVIYLTKGSESFAVKKGDTFDSSYRLENMENGNLTIRYLPMGTNQILPIGTAQ